MKTTTDEEQPTMPHDPSEPAGDTADESPQPPPTPADRPANPQPLRGVLRVAGRPPRSGGVRRVRFADGDSGGERSRNWDTAKVCTVGRSVLAAAAAAAAAATAAELVGRPRGVLFLDRPVGTYSGSCMTLTLLACSLDPHLHLLLFNHQFHATYIDHGGVCTRFCTVQPLDLAVLVE